MAVFAPPITLRPALPGDDAFLLRVYASTRAEELAPVPWSDEQKEAFVRHQFESQSVYYREQYTNASHDVIEVDGESAGRLYVARWESEIRVMDIALLPEYRGHGIGSQLLSQVLAEGAETGKKVSIHVEPVNPARRLYERLGFVPVEDKGACVLMEARPE
jgi:ribosomal protein S18 acetylase RimI-like enzyme